MTSSHQTRNRIMQGLLLLGVFVVAFLIRADACRLPTVASEERAYLQDENGDPYLTEMDSYFYLRKAQEMAESGEIRWSADRSADPMIGQRTVNPENKDVLPLGLPVLACLLWKYVLSFFGVSLFRTAIWLGPVLGSLAVIPAFCYVRRRTSLPGGIAAGLLVGTAIPFVIHTHAGFFDTDMVLALLPLAAILSQIASMRAATRKRRIVFALSGAAAFVLLSLFWEAWYVYFLLAAAATGIAGLCIRLFSCRWFAGDAGKRMREIREGGLLTLGISLALILLIGGADMVQKLSGALHAYRLSVGSTGVMPSVFAKVEEMQPLRLFPSGGLISWIRADLRSVIGRTGGILPVALACGYLPVGFILCGRAQHVGVQRQDTDAQESQKIRAERASDTAEEWIALVLELCFLGLWAVIGVYLTCKGKRMAEIAVLPVSILAGLMIGRLFSFAGRLCRYRKPAVLLLSLLLAAAVYPVCRGAIKGARQNRSLVTDSKCEIMTYLRDTTPADAALAAWWDDGYYMEYQARRRTLADGGTDSAEENWLLAAALLTEDPEQMHGILRMLNEYGTDALRDLSAAGMSQADAAALLLRLLALDREKAGEVLAAQGLPAEILEKTHPAATAPLYLVLHTNLLRIHKALAYFGFWDPQAGTQRETTALMFSAASVLLQQEETELPLVNPEYTIYLGRNAQGGLLCTYGHQEKKLTPCRLQVWENGTLLQEERAKMETEKEKPSEAEGGREAAEETEGDRLAVVILKEGNRYCGILCSENLCDSMLVRLLVCEDKTAGHMAYIGTWYGDGKKDPAMAQQRIDSTVWTSQATQVWEIG